MSDADTPIEARRDLRPWIYGVLDLAFVSLYLLLAIVLVPARNTSGMVLQWLLVLTMAAACVGSFSRTRRGWQLALVGCASLLLAECVLLILLLMSASYLAGVYGSFGLGASALTLVIVVLSVQLVAFLPALQLKYLLSKGGRRAFGTDR